jgi:hypothetical protein
MAPGLGSEYNENCKQQTSDHTTAPQKRYTQPVNARRIVKAQIMLHFFIQFFYEKT